MEEGTTLAEFEADLLSLIRQNFSGRLVPESSLARSLYAELETKRAVLEAKRDGIGAFQYGYDQAETDHNLKETELDEGEQVFENLIFGILGLSDSSKNDAFRIPSNEKSQSESNENSPSQVLESKPQPKPYQA